MEKKKYIHWSYNSGAGFIKLCSEVVKETASHYTVIFTQSGMKTDVANVLRLCVCLPLAQCFDLTTNFMGQIAQNRCYTLFVLIFCAEGN